MVSMNNVGLSDDELTLTVSSLVATITDYEMHIENNGKDSLDHTSLKSLEEMKTLYKELEACIFRTFTRAFFLFT